MGYVLILGANTEIGKVLADKYASEGYHLYLADDDTEQLEKTAEYLQEMFENDVQVKKFNVLEFYTHRNFYKSLETRPLGAVFAVDYLGDQNRAQKDFLEAKKIIDTNYTGLVSMLNIVANDFEEAKDGFIVAIGSIVGEYNEEKLYTYSGAKLGFMSHLEGIKGRLKDSNVKVLKHTPSFVHTEITRGLGIEDKNICMPGDVAEEVFDLQQKGEESGNETGFLKMLFPFFVK